LLQGGAGRVSLIVNLDEFSELCGVTAETMRVHIRAVEGSPMWLIERGDRGRGYRIEAEGGIAWWKAKRDADEQASEERKAQLAQLRFEHLGDAADEAEALALSGRQRREEYAAVIERIKLRRIMGELIERAEIEPLLTHAAVEARRRLMLVPGEYAALIGLPAADVAPLTELIERAVGDFVDSLALPASGSEAA
jgi:hypothetical protein